MENITNLLYTIQSLKQQGLVMPSIC